MLKSVIGEILVCTCSPVLCFVPFGALQPHAAFLTEVCSCLRIAVFRWCDVFQHLGVHTFRRVASLALSRFVFRHLGLHVFFCPRCKKTCWADQACVHVFRPASFIFFRLVGLCLSSSIPSFSCCSSPSVVIPQVVPLGPNLAVRDYLVISLPCLLSIISYKKKA